MELLRATRSHRGLQEVTGGCGGFLESWRAQEVTGDYMESQWDAFSQIKLQSQGLVD
jgi:hypothetical protein